MGAVSQLVQFIKEIFSWWFIITPWEEGVFVRMGKKAKVLKAGIYYKIPFIDQVYVQSIRIRTVDLPIQTVSTKDGKTITVKAMIGYSIQDIYMLYNTLSHPDMTLSGIVMAEISEYIRNTDYSEVNINSLEKEISKRMEQEKYGLGDLSIRITSWALVRTFRLIQDPSWMRETVDMSKMGN